MYSTLAGTWYLAPASKWSSDRGEGGFNPWYSFLFQESSHQFVSVQMSSEGLITSIATSGCCIGMRSPIRRKCPTDICQRCKQKAGKQSCLRPWWIESWWTSHSHQWEMLRPAGRSLSGVWVSALKGPACRPPLRGSQDSLLVGKEAADLCTASSIVHVPFRAGKRKMIASSSCAES